MVGRRTTWPRPALIAAASCLVVLASTVGSTAAMSGAAWAAATPQHWTVAVGAQSPHGAIQTMSYYPAHLWVDQGDTVTWVIDGAEPHTVTFFSTDSPCPSDALCSLPQFDLSDPLQALPQGGTSYDGHSYYNSGLMTTATSGLPLPPSIPIVTSYTLSIPDTLAPGTYHYICLLHGVRMQGEVIVQQAGTPYPFTQAQVSRQAHRQQQADIADGYRLWARARVHAAELNRTGGPTVLVGAMDDRAMVMRFIPSLKVLRAGSSVRFLSNAMDTPHTVTFGDDVTGCGSPPCNPFAPWNVTFGGDGNAMASYPGLNGGFTGDPTQLSSGVMFGLPPSLTGAPEEFTLTVTKAGWYYYFCALHDFMGMAGRLLVVPGHHS